MAAEVVDKNLLDDEEDEFSKDSVSMRKLREISGWIFREITIFYTF